MVAEWVFPLEKALEKALEALRVKDKGMGGEL
jgi:hypothetical protein